MACLYQYKSMKTASTAFSTVVEFFVCLTSHKSFWVVVTALLVLWLAWQAVTGPMPQSETTRVQNGLQERNVILGDAMARLK